MTTWPSERIPEYLALVDAANEWQAAWDACAVVDSRAIRDWAETRRAREELQRAIDTWHRCHVAWLKATNDNREGN